MSAERWPKKVISGNVVVRVYKVKHATSKTGNAYVLAYQDGGQRRLQKFADPGAALAEARLKADQLNAGRIAGASMSAGDRDELQAARRLAGAVPVVAALEEWQRGRKLCGGSIIPACELWAATQTAKLEDVTAAEASRRYLESRRRAGMNTKAGMERTLPKFLETFGGQNMTTISARGLQAWLDEIANPASRNSHRKRIITFFRWARKAGMLPAAAQTEIEKTDRAKVPPLEIGILTGQQFAAALDLMRRKHREYLAVTVLAGFCGLRRKELHAQAWKDVQLDRGHLRVTAAKSNTPSKRLVPICPAAVEWLMLCKRKGDLVSPAWGIDRVRAFCREAKIPCPENGFRHGYISHRVAQTGNVAETSLEAGNSVQVIHAHYRELVSKAEGEAWFSLRPGEKPAGQARGVANA